MDDVAEEDALVVKVLRDAGAVFHVKTCNPQALMVCLNFVIFFHQRNWEV